MSTCTLLWRQRRTQPRQTKAQRPSRSPLRASKAESPNLHSTPTETGPPERNAIGCTTRPTTLILVPGRLGGLHLFERTGAAMPKRGLWLDHPGQLRDFIRTRPRSTVVLCGSRYALCVARAVCHIADLYLVPLTWLRSVQRDQLQARAALAARLATAHRARPIECIARREPCPLPF